MNGFQASMLLISSATLGGYISSRHFKTQPSISILLLSVILVQCLNLTESLLGPLGFYADIIETVSHSNFEFVLMDCLLPILLFAGSMALDSQSLMRLKSTIFTLSIFSTIGSTLFIGAGLYYLSNMLALNLEPIYCLLFGALISPTDPVAVLGMLKKTNIDPDIETKIAGESLFNDGVGIVLFLLLYELKFSGITPTIMQTLVAFIYETIGGILVGYIFGKLCHWIMHKENNDPHLNIIVSIFIVTGMYTLTNAAHMSGPIAVVVCGLSVSHYLSLFPSSKDQLHQFWSVLEELLNMILYLLIGLESLIIPINFPMIMLALGSIFLVLISRTITVSLPMLILSRFRTFKRGTITMLIWGGLRGGLAIALVFSLPNTPEREIILVATYAVVCFSTIIQGGSISALIARKRL